MNNGNDLLETIEELRLRKYSHIPKDLVEKILIIEENTVQERSEGLKNIRDEIEHYLGDKKN